uniref:Secreted protein n=1 Tax=Steinernema glaseri TaxID=37863 RepID=A0A1I7Y0R4_9BILA
MFPAVKIAAGASGERLCLILTTRRRSVRNLLLTTSVLTAQPQWLALALFGLAVHAVCHLTWRFGVISAKFTFMFMLSSQSSVAAPDRSRQSVIRPKRVKRPSDVLTYGVHSVVPDK